MKKYADQGFKFIFVYAREAHPGENYPAHQTLEQKLDHARSLQSVLDVRRTILVDDVEGTGHELYGTLPNMTYVIDRGGKVLFRSDWTDPPTIERVLDYILDPGTTAGPHGRRRRPQVGPLHRSLQLQRRSNHFIALRTKQRGVAPKPPVCGQALVGAFAGPDGSRLRTSNRLAQHAATGVRIARNK